ncbi:MAG: pyridoxine 5'-phosphate synthase [Chitinophagales bacterium]|nr:pyridoxine 5'-phosphate synthase [Chitinophagales bacterium]MDW8392907.1 pyridoxine 5'-phosphate synthase [Chitinophagales bacterium]
MIRLSVNINKFATLRNARGGNLPDVVAAARNCERFGADGITVHPRPDQRHIRYDDVLQLKEVVTTEFNIEGNPISTWLELVQRVRPAQATLVPDGHDVLTSNAGWDTIKHQAFLRDIISALKSHGIRVSVFIDPLPAMAEGARAAGADRIELYTGPYAQGYHQHPQRAVAPYVETAQVALQLGLGINAGHDLNLHNLAFLARHLPGLAEVSIGHALICDAIYLGLENTIQLYKRQLTAD